MYRAIKKTKHSTSHVINNDMLNPVAELILEKLSTKSMDKLSLSKALHDVLDARDDQGRLARKYIQMHILEVNERLAYGQIEDRLLTTEQAAQMMMKSRPYVAMLIDAGELEGAQTTPKGHRRVPESSVRNWLSKHGKTTQTGSSDYKSAARDAGMYTITDTTYLESTKKGRNSA